MSELQEDKTVFENLDSLKKACLAIYPQAKFTENAHVNFYYGKKDKDSLVDLVMSLPKNPNSGYDDKYYDIGFRKQDNNTYSIVADHELLTCEENKYGWNRAKWGQEIIGRNAAKLKQEYHAIEITRKAALKGAQTYRELLPDGTLVITTKGGRI